MLVLSRRLHEKILLPVLHTTVEVVGISASRVRLGISAPPQVTVLREELQTPTKEWDDSPTPAGVPRSREFHQCMRGQLDAAALSVERLRRQLPPGQSHATLAELAENIRQLRENLAVEASRLPVPAGAQISAHGSYSLLANR